MELKKWTLKRLNVLMLLLMLILFLLSAAVHYVSSIENSREYISPETIKTAQIIVFYKEDCPKCQKVMPKKIVKNCFEQNSVFVNLNNEKNRQYIRIYNLKAVPTVIERKSKVH